MTDFNPIQNICPQCGALINADLPGYDDSPWNKAGLGQDTEASILAGHLSLSSSGLIIDADVFCAELLGVDKSALPGKPFNLFIHRDDMVDWFAHRNTLSNTRTPQSFEIRLYRSDQSIFKAKLQCDNVDDEGEKSGGMRIAIRDYTQRRQVLDQLEYVQNLNQIIAQITADMIRCPAREVGAVVAKVLKTLGVFSEVDRIYFGLVDDKKRSFVPSYEWQPPDKGVFEPTRAPILLNRLPELQKAVIKRKAIFRDRYPSDRPSKDKGHQKEGPKQFHMDGTRSYAIFPVGNDDSGWGIIGYDITQAISGHPERFSYLFRFAGQAFLNALRRKKDEAVWLKRYQKVLEDVTQRGDKSNKKAIVEAVSDRTGKKRINNGRHDEPIPLMTKSSSGDELEIYNVATPKEEKTEKSEWSYQTSEKKDDYQALQNVRIIDKRVVITCPRCNNQDRPSQEAFNAVGKTVLATCPCDYQFDVQSEKRLLHRKAVDLEGVFVRTQGQHFRSDSMNYSGKAQIANISKQGIGFYTEGLNHLNVGDQVRIKFTLDNQSRSLITKHVLIKGTQDRYAGGQFVGADRHDITLGFYLM